jgi:hypothetical protein
MGGPAFGRPNDKLRETRQLQFAKMMGFANAATRPTLLARFGLSDSRSVAALAFHHLVALLDQALSFAIFALGLLLDVRAFFIGHDGHQGEVRPLDCDRRIRIERLIAATNDKQWHGVRDGLAERNPPNSKDITADHAFGCSPAPPALCDKLHG